MAGALINPTLLGYPDEEILDKHFSQIDFTTSKIGGLPVSELTYFILQNQIWKNILEQLVTNAKKYKCYLNLVQKF